MFPEGHSSKDRRKFVVKKDRQRSRVTNGALLPGIDGRSAWVRRCKDVIASHLADNPEASAAEQSIIRRASVLTVELERLEVRFALAGEADNEDLDLYARTAGNLKRLLEAVGLKRVTKNVTPDPLAYARKAPLEAEDASVSTDTDRASTDTEDASA